ncbi:hypothetical protein BN1708_007073 [Verticillium longisporum]|uniref:Uncharacterized protein n=1 Tax=Verticillium longisporum TaxID=100787 RepID=A0A0G4MQP3_VERLO|nr:hypothetical protein BN1708_007073 [Verticillium longisporum]
MNWQDGGMTIIALRPACGLGTPSAGEGQSLQLPLFWYKPGGRDEEDCRHGFGFRSQGAQQEIQPTSWVLQEDFDHREVVAIWSPKIRS